MQHRFAVTAEIVAAITSSLVLEEVLATVAERIAGALGLWECDIYEYRADEGRAVAEALWTRTPDPRDAGWLGSSPSPDEQPLLYSVLRERRSLEAQIDDPALPAGERAMMRHWGEQSCLYLPLIFKDQVIGCLELVEKRHARRFTASERELAATLASLAAIAIENARLFGSVERLAITDGLTGLYNHRSFFERLSEELARARRYQLPLSLLMLDVDDFKRFNDRFGHLAGDALLRELAALLAAQTRERVDFVARYGGEEFAVILPSTGAVGATALAGRLRAVVRAEAIDRLLTEASPAGGDGEAAEALAERIRHGVERRSFGTGEQPPVVTVSVGVATLETHDTTVDSLVEAADKALYRAKANGKNRVEVATS